MKLEIINNTTSLSGWDISAFYALGSPSKYDDWLNNVPAGTEALFGSITIDGKPYWGAEANYILWGFAFRMFHEHMLEAGGGKIVNHFNGMAWEPRYDNPNGGIGPKIMTLEDALALVKIWRAGLYGIRETFDETNPARRSSGSGIFGWLAFTQAGWDFYGEGPGKRGDFSIASVAKISDREVLANPCNLATFKSNFGLSIGGKKFPAKVEVNVKDLQQ